MQIVFHVQGSSPDPYRVTIEKQGGNLNAYCTCAAGANGQVCKHRLRLLSGNPEGVVSGDRQRLSELVDWVNGTDVEVAIKELAVAEDRYALAKTELLNAKRRLAAALRI